MMHSFLSPNLNPSSSSHLILSNPPLSPALFFLFANQSITQVTANITLKNVGSYQALYTTEGGETALLEWREKDSFQITLRGIPVPCAVLSSGHIGAWVYFKRNLLGSVISLTVPGIAYEQVYIKDKN